MIISSLTKRNNGQILDFIHFYTKLYIFRQHKKPRSEFSSDLGIIKYLRFLDSQDNGTVRRELELRTAQARLFLAC